MVLVHCVAASGPFCKIEILAAEEVRSHRSNCFAKHGSLRAYSGRFVWFISSPSLVYNLYNL